MRFGILTFLACLLAGCGGGGSNTIHGDILIRRVNLQTNDLAYDRVSDRIFASVPDTQPKGYGNSVVSIDPRTASITGSIFIGSNPGPLAVSDDGAFLYVGLKGVSAIQRVDLRTMEPDLRFNLPVGIYGPTYANDIAVMPGNAHAVAISRIHPGIVVGYAGTAVYDDGVARPNVLTWPSAAIADYITFGASASRLYGYDAETTLSELSRMDIDSSGVKLRDFNRDLIYGFGRITYSGGRIYSVYGQIVDPEAGVQVGTFDLGTSNYGVLPTEGFAVDQAAGRAFYCVTNPYNFNLTLLEFSTTTFLPVTSRDISVSSDFSNHTVVHRMVACGSGAVAFDTHAGQSREFDQVIIVAPVPGP